MTREEAISVLEARLLSDDVIYVNDFSYSEALSMATDALKAQEPVEPILDETGMFYCADCKKQPVGYKNFAREVFRHNLYCPKCGRKVKWDE